MYPCVLILSALLLTARAYAPHDLGNFQNEYVCDTSIRLVRPWTLQDVQDAVRLHSRVVPVGEANSHNRFFCAPAVGETTDDEDTTASILMTTVRPLTIDVDEENMSAWVSAGILVRDMADYLAAYVTQSSPRGYALGMTSGWVSMTVAGAVATDTHGSSLTHGSISDQVIGFRVILANGTTTEIYPETHPFYFRAFRVNVGRLGIVTHVQFRIIKETVIRRTVYRAVPPQDFVEILRHGQETYKSTGEVPDNLDGMVGVYVPSEHAFTIFNFEETDTPLNISGEDMEELESESDAILADLMLEINAPYNESRSESRRRRPYGVTWEVPDPVQPNSNYTDPSFSAVIDGIRLDTPLITNATGEINDVRFTIPVEDGLSSHEVLFDDYELSVPVSKMADCLEGALDLIESELPESGIRTFAFFRLVPKETGLLSAAHDEPRMWFDWQDHVYYNQERTRNEPFQRLLAYMVSSPLCSQTSFHWGKAGFPDPGCWNGAEVFPNTWCDFGCAVQDLDPEDKFISSRPDIWNWAGANLETCCTSDGYDYTRKGCTCNVQRLRSVDDCPPAPYYSSR